MYRGGAGFPSVSVFPGRVGLSGCSLGAAEFGNCPALDRVYDPRDIGCGAEPIGSNDVVEGRHVEDVKESNW